MLFVHGINRFSHDVAQIKPSLHSNNGCFLCFQRISFSKFIREKKKKKKKMKNALAEDYHRSLEFRIVNNYLKLRTNILTYVDEHTEMNHDMSKPTKWLWPQRSLRSACASAQSDQSLRSALNGYLRTQGFFMRTAKTLIRLGGCPGWSESSLGAESLCWFCHEAAQIETVLIIVHF